MSTLSLITASYNSAATIRDTVDSIEKQTFKNIEYILVDGASKDNTVDIVKQNSTCLKKWVSEPDKGIYDAMNKGIAMTTGDVVGIINSDDFYCSDDVLEEVMKCFEDPSVDAVHGDLVYVDGEDTNKILRDWKSKEEYVEGDFARGVICAHPTLFVRKSVYERAGNFNLNYALAADFEFILRILYKYKFKAVYLPKILVKMRAGGATGESMSAIKKQNIEILDALKTHKVPFSKISFIFHKLYNRITQRVKAGKVQLPSSK